MSNHFIPLPQAITMTSLFRAERDAVIDPSLRGQDILFISETFDKAAFDTLLGETDAAGLRFYLGMDENLQVRIVAVATDSQGNDILPDPITFAEPPGGAKIVEIGVRCPPICPPTGLRLLSS